MRWTLALPGWAWIVIILFVYIVIRSPATGVFVLSIPARLVSGLGNGLITIFQSYMH
jgi:hypothetical protein